MVNLSLRFNVGKFGILCAERAWSMWQGGNFWSGWTAFLTFFRYVAKLDIDYSKFEHWEKATIHGSVRFVHDEFCIVSDFPTQILQDDQHRGHCFDGPYIKWSDGTGIYQIHGINVPAWICETPRNEFTKEMILKEENVDYRRCIIQKIGITKAIEILGAEVVDTYDSQIGGRYELLMIDYDNRGTKRPYLKMSNPSLNDTFHVEGVEPNIKTAKAAIMYRNGLKTFIEPVSLS